MGLGSLNYSNLICRWPAAIASASPLVGLSKMVGEVLRYGVTHCRNPLLHVNRIDILGRRVRCLRAKGKARQRPECPYESLKSNARLFQSAQAKLTRALQSLHVSTNTYLST